MSEESGNLDKLVESVADGESIDWDELDRVAPAGETHRLLRLLRLVADVAEVHRSPLDEDALAADAAITGSTRAPSGNAGEEPRRVRPDVDGTPISGHEGVWGHLVLVRKIGEGSFGEVYRAHDTWLDHPVALKLLKREAENRVAPSVLLHEARKLARVRHTNVVTVHGADRHEGRVGFWMDFVDGETLASVLARGRLSAGEAAHVGQEVCRALAAVHAAKLIHRDVKAQNVMRAFDGGRIILMDFGAGEFVDEQTPGKRAEGTPLYLAPELLRGEDASVRSDIYALGVLLYHLVTGRFPVEAPSLAALADAHAQGARKRLRDERPDLPDSFIATVERAIDADPQRRYGSAGEMEATLAGQATAGVEKHVAVDSKATVSTVAGRSLAHIAAIATGVVASAAALTGTLGFIAARSFEVVLRIDPDFDLGPADIFTVGAQALFPFVGYWVVGIAVVGALSGLRLLLPERIAGIGRQRLSALASLNPAGIGAIVFVGGAVLLVAITWKFWAVFSVLWALRQDPQLPSTGLFILSRASRSVHVSHGGYSALLSFLLGLAVWRAFPVLEKRAEEVSTVRVMKWGTLAVALLAVALAVVPRRAVWESFAIVRSNRPALVIGTTSQELLLYAPDEPGRPRFRLRKDEPGLQQTGETRALFDPARPLE